MSFETGSSLSIAVHDVWPETQARCEAMLQGLAQRGWMRTALMVVPDFGGRHPLRAHPDFVAWLREKVEQGHEVWAHGLTHRALPHARAQGWRGRAVQVVVDAVQRHLTRGESEFLGLALETKKTRLMQALQAFRDQGFSVTGFTPPTWFGAVPSSLLRELEVRFQDTRFGILDARNDAFRVMPALVWPDAEKPASAWGGSLYLAWLKNLAHVRFALHPQDPTHADFWPTLEAIGRGRKLRTAEECFAGLSETSPSELHFHETLAIPPNWPAHPL